MQLIVISSSWKLKCFRSLSEVWRGLVGGSK